MIDGRTPEPTAKDYVGDVLEPFSTAEADRCTEVVEMLTDQVWARPLLRTVGPRSEWSRARSPFFFELRIAGELFRRGLDLQYEAPAADGKTIDFRFQHNGVTWLVEARAPLTSIHVRKAVVRHEDAGVWEVPLSSHNTDQNQTHAAELIRLQGLVVEKAPKFLDPIPDTIHVVLVDTRRVGITGVDRPDAMQFALGPDPVGTLANRIEGELVRGIFEPDEFPPISGIDLARKRIHFVAFSRDRDYGQNTLLNRMNVVHNPLLMSAEEAQAVWNQGLWVWNG